MIPPFFFVEALLLKTNILEKKFKANRNTHCLFQLKNIYLLNKHTNKHTSIHNKSFHDLRLLKMCILKSDEGNVYLKCDKKTIA